MRDRLIELLQSAVGGCARHWAEVIADHLLAEGVIAPPCKVEQDGYWVTTYGIVPVTFDRILLSMGNEWKVRARYFVKETAYFLFEDFGKTIFLTRQEAEKALAERNGGV